ncbi:HAMP domain-containing protein [Gloeobacter morelensis MG652769]|uniref:histidine kinase n=1 Tax=Gloeobacter morelensis MG652769 TaxID=2781736 RepID=A0ABY3PGR7_9CYAN|nr:HAMP domain-containing protein [Gloeobacter morelensis MG652769]
MGIWQNDVIAVDITNASALNFSKNLQRWFSEFRIQTRLLAAAALIISLVLASFTFWALNYIQEDARRSDQRFGEAVGNLLAATAAPLIALDQYPQLGEFTEEFLASNADNILYVLYADSKGDILYGSPFNTNDTRANAPVPALIRHIELPPVLPAKRQHRTPRGLVTDIFVPIEYGERQLGVVLVGINPEANLVSRSDLTRDVTVAVFVLVWIIAILGSVFNALTITQPLKELVQGVQRIAQGNFKQRVTLAYPGEIGELITSFNLMAQRLQSYEEQNIEEITAEKAKLETFIATIADGGILLDSSLRILLVNPAMLRIFGWGPRVVGKNILDLLPVGMRAEVEEPLDSVSRNILEQAECRVVLDKRTLRVLISPVLAPRGDNLLKGVVLTVQDLSKEAELNQAKSQFISNVSHELRTPLSSIKSYIETVYEFGDSLDDSTKNEFLKTANQETDRLTRLVNDVLDLSRLESGREYHFEPVDLVQPIEQTLRTHRLTARDREIELASDIATDLPLVLGNYDLLQQVFSNLVGNALKFTEPGGRVTLSARRTDDPARVRVAVTDTGIGISEEDQRRIFERFFRVENRVHTLEGTGLGLSIVDNIVKKHNAQVHIESKVGQGSTFWFDVEAYRETCEWPRREQKEAI